MSEPGAIPIQAFEDLPQMLCVLRLVDSAFWWLKDFRVYGGAQWRLRRVQFTSRDTLSPFAEQSAPHPVGLKSLCVSDVADPFPDIHIPLIYQETGL